MNIQTIIQQRRSIYPASYLDKPISKETLWRVLECANHAPTHKLTEPWRFTVFHNEGLIKLADELTRLYSAVTPPEQFLEKKQNAIRDKVSRSAAVLAISVHFSGTVPREEELLAVACAVQNTWLAASAEGIGAYWSTPGYIPQLHAFLGLSEQERCIGLFYMGYHDEPMRESKRTPMAEKVSWVDR